MNGQKILLHAGMEYSLWLSNPRMSILLVLLTLIHVMVIRPLAEAGSQIGEGFHLLEPMAALCNSTLILLILPIGFLILIADYPRLNQGFLLQIYRVGRLNWVLGELLHLCMAAVTYLAAVLLGTFLLSLPYMPVTSPGWSTIATEYTEIMGDSALKVLRGSCQGISISRCRQVLLLSEAISYCCSTWYSSGQSFWQLAFFG